MHDVVRALDAQIQQAIWVFMDQYNIYAVVVAPQQFTITCGARLPLLDHPTEVARNFFKMAANLCDLFESADKGVGWTPGVYYKDGERVEMGERGERASCAARRLCAYRDV